MLSKLGTYIFVAAKSSMFLLLLLILTSFGVRSQLCQSFKGVQFSPKYGFLVPHRSTMGHLVQGHTTFFELGASFQMDGSSQWHHQFNMPSVNFVANYMDFGNREVLGTAFGGQITTFLPYFRKNGWAFGSRLGAGLGWVSKKFDQYENPKNNAIGSKLNVLVSFGLKLEKQFNQSSLGLEVNMSHLSNGAYKLPNLGLNLPLIGLQYTYFLEELKYMSAKNLPKENIHEQWSFLTQLIVSTKQIYPTGGSNYGVIGLTNMVQLSTGPKAKFELGLDAIYNQSVIRDVPGDYGPSKNFQMGTYLAYILPIHRVDFLLAMGHYLYNPLDPKGMIYHKLGTRINLTDRLKANIVIKAHWAKADYFEYGLTYRW